MAHFDCEVDTRPMAKEIGRVADKIDKTTSAVVAMKLAVIKAESDAADSVCQNVNRGFYALIRSQISQKMAKLQSDVDSHFLKLDQLRKQLIFIRGRMERDYGTLANRYMKLFGVLNKNLERRIYELDKPTIKFAKKEINTINNRSRNLPGVVPIGQDESLRISQKILTSNMKFRGKKLIESMMLFLSGVYEQKRLTKKILLPMQIKHEAASVMVPVVISESNFDERGNMNVGIVLNTTQLSQRTCEEIKSTINSGYNNIAWQQQSEIDQEIKNEFNKLIAESSKSKRVKDMAYNLFMANKFQIVKDF